MALRTLYQSFLDSDPSRLRVIAQLWKAELQSSKKTDMAAELVTALANAEAVDRSLETLSAEEREALDDLVRHGGAVPWSIFTRRWGQVRAIGPGRIEREGLWRDPASAAESLSIMGWIHRAFDDHIGKPVEMAFVPEELMLYLPAPPPRQVTVPPTVEPPPIVLPGDDTLADDLVTLWSALQRGDQTREAILSQLHPPAARRLQLLDTLSIEAGWVRRADNDAVRPVPNAILGWLQADPWTQWSALAQAWTTSQAYHDVSLVPTLTPDPVNLWPNEPQRTRQAFLAVAKYCDPAAWYDIGTFVQYVKETSTDFLRPDGDYDSWAPRDAQSADPLRGFGAWDAVEGALITDMISGTMSWLGLVDLGQETPEALPTAFKLTEAGAALLSGSPPPSFPLPEHLALDDYGEILAPARRRYERFQLSRIAEAIGAPGVYRFRLSPASVNRAKQQRISPDRITDFLKKGTGRKSLPTGMEAAIQRAYQRDEGGHLSRVWVLRVPDPQILPKPNVQALVEEQIMPTMATVFEGHAKQIIQRLLAEGILVDITPEDIEE